MESSTYVHKQSIESTRTINALQEQVELAEVFNDQQMESSTYVHKQPIELTSTINALQEQVELAEVFNDQQMESSTYVHKQPIELTSTINALQEQVELAEVFNDQQMESSTYVHEQSSELKSTINALQEQVELAEVFNDQQMESSTYVHKQPIELTSTIYALQEQVELAEVFNDQQMESSTYVHKQPIQSTSLINALQEEVKLAEVLNDQRMESSTYVHKQPIESTHTINALQEQVELAEIINDQQMESSTYVHKQPIQSTSIIHALQEQVELAEVFNDQQIECSTYVHKQPIELTNTVTALQEQAEITEIMYDSHMDNSGDLQEQSPINLTSTTTALHEQVEYNEVFSEQHFENSIYIYKQSADLTKTIVALQEQVEHGGIVNDIHMKNNRHLHEQSTNSTNNIAVLQEQVTEEVSEQHSNARQKEQNEHTTIFFTNQMLELNNEKIGILPATTHKAAENNIVQNELPSLLQNSTDYTQQQGHDHDNAAIHSFSGQSTGAVENISMEQTMEFTAEVDGKDGGRSVEINEIISAIPLEQRTHLEVFIQNFTRNLRESQDLHPYIVKDSRCHKCNKRCPRLLSFGCNYTTHKLCEKHLEMLLGLNFTDITEPSANFNHCPICCFKCSCWLCRSRLQKLWREHRHKNNNSLVCCSLTGDSNTVDESLFLISGNENVELDLNVVDIPKQQDTINIRAIEYEGNNGKCSPPANKDPLNLSSTRNESILQGPDDKLLIMDTDSDVKEVQKSLLEENEFSNNDIIFRKVAEMHPVSHSTFVEIINREKQKYHT
jgi:hypothetical protein